MPPRCSLEFPHNEKWLRDAVDGAQKSLDQLNSVLRHFAIKGSPTRLASEELLLRVNALAKEIDLRIKSGNPKL